MQLTARCHNHSTLPAAAPHRVRLKTEDAARLAWSILVVLVRRADGNNNGPFWSAYEPSSLQIVAESLTTINGSIGHQPSSNIGPDGQIVLQGTQHLWASEDNGRSYKSLCPTPQPGNPSGVGILADGHTLLMARNAMGFGAGCMSPRPDFPWGANCTDNTVIYRGSLKAPGCGWSAPMPLEPVWAGAGLGTDASIRFRQGEDGTVYYPVAMVPPASDGSPPPPSSRYQLTSVYASTDQGLSFGFRGNMVRHTCETDILPLGNDTLLASIRYQTPNSLRGTAGDPPTGAAVPGHQEAMQRFKQTAVSHSGE